MLFKNYLTSIFRELAFKSISCYAKHFQIALCHKSNLDPFYECIKGYTRQFYFLTLLHTAYLEKSFHI